MTIAADELLIQNFADFLAKNLGLDFSRDRWSDLQRGLNRAAPDFGFADAESCMHGLLGQELTQLQIETLARHLTIGETYFFREPNSFKALANLVLPGLIAERRRTLPALTLWSAACCSGEEAYSIAMLLDQMLPDIKDWRITVIGTDIHSGALQRAIDGVYGPWSFRGVDPAIRERYFIPRSQNQFELVPKIKQMVNFSFHNLVNPPYPAPIPAPGLVDIIFCRNVLMYFTPHHAKQAVGHLYTALHAQGWLVASPVEASPLLFDPFSLADEAEVSLYRKERPRPAPDSAAPLPPAAPPPPPEARVIYTPPPRPEPELSAPQLLAKAQALANQGALTEALHWCQQALAQDRLTPEPHYLLAMIHQERGALDAATDALRRALYLDPGYCLAYLALAALARRRGHWAEARRHYENALALLGKCADDTVLAQADGLTVARLIAITRQAASELP